MRFHDLIFLLLVRVLTGGSVQGQPRADQDLERLQYEADWHFKQGSYQRATNLYRACVAFPYLDDKKPFQEKLNKAQRIIQLDNASTEALRRGDRVRALALTQQILQINPADPYAKATLNDLRVSQNAIFSAQDSRLIAQANAFYEKGQWEAASRIYALIYKLPNGKPHPELAARKQAAREMAQFESEYQIAVQQGNMGKANQIARIAKTKFPKEAGIGDVLKPHITISTMVLDSFLKQIEAKMSQCAFDQAAALLSQFRKQHPEWSADVLVGKYARQLRSIETETYKVQNGQGAPAFQAETKRAYNVLRKLRPTCFTKPYFEYVLKIATIRQQNENHVGAILEFQLAQKINSTLARQNQIVEKIAKSDSVLKCGEKATVFKKMLADATKAYQACDCETATTTWQKAQAYICPQNKNSQNEWEKWQTNVEDCRTNRRIISQFDSLLQRANQSFELQGCRKAKALFMVAEGLQTRCGVLAKTGLARATTRCDSCITRQQYDSTVVLASQKIADDQKSDALTLFKQALPIAPPDRAKGIQKQIDRLTCELNLPGCLTQILPPPPPIRPVLVKIMPLGGFGVINPVLIKGIGGAEESTLVSPHFMAGSQINFISQKWPVSARVSIQYANYRLFTAAVGSKIREDFIFRTVQIPISIKLHSPPKPSQIGKARPYAHLGYVLTQRLSFTYKNYSSDKQYTASEFTVNRFSPLNAGIGVEKNRKQWGFWADITYQTLRENIFSENYPFALEKIDAAFLSVGLRYGW